MLGLRPLGPSGHPLLSSMGHAMLHEERLDYFGGSALWFSGNSHLDALAHQDCMFTR